MSVSLGPSIAALLTMVSLDAVWLTTMRPMYASAVQAVQGQALAVRWGPALIAYAVVLASILLLVLPAVSASLREAPAAGWQKLARVAGIAGAYGFTVYAVFNATVLAVFKDYPWPAALVDTAWGTFLYIAVAYAATNAAQKSQ